jgi:HAD superfamily hydrolase (TIGR01549 family)
VTGEVRAVTMDFYNTLAFHRDGRGRGRALMEFLSAQGFSPHPWEHRILYDLFADHSTAFSTRASVGARRRYLVKLAEHAFRSLSIPASREDAEELAEPIWRILGPDSLAVFPEVRSTLRRLRGRGLRLAVLSNWQNGLIHFCEALGLAPYFDHVLCSAEVGFEKPDVRIFGRASERLALDPRSIVHVGDTLRDDYYGARAAGFGSVLLARQPGSEGEAENFIRSLGELPELLGKV